MSRKDYTGLESYRKICKSCGKPFMIQCHSLWTYKISLGGGSYNYYCSYSCYSGKKTEKKKLTNEEAYWERKRLKKKEANKKRREARKNDLRRDEQSVD